ncbi:MAG: hypothetical protein IKV99_08065 [Oscillospiraceae bacterium]|nr:hypothetical protein [Oscillospiraceae bacterium]
MKKFISLALALVMALSLTTIAWGAATEMPAAQNGVVNLTEDVVLSEQWVVTENTTLNLNGYTISNTADIWNTSTGAWSLISVQGGTLTINGDGTVKAKENDCYAIDIRGGAACVINGGEYIGNCSSVYVKEGTLTVNSGYFAVQQQSTAGNGYGEVLNCFDANYTAGTAKVIVNGGIFKGFDPTDAAEPAGDEQSYVASGYEAAGVGANGEVIVGQDIEVDSNGNITGGTFADDVSEYMADGYAIVNGEVAKATPAGNTTTYDIKDLTVTDPYGVKQDTTGLTAIVKVASVTNTSTVNGKTTTTFVPAWYQVSAGASARTFVECDKSVADYMFTIKNVGSVYVREMPVPADFDATPVSLYTAPKTATCGMVGANEDVYVVVNGKYYAAKNTVVPGVEKYALVNGNMVVYYGEATAKDHNWTTATVASYDAKTGAITSVKCADCKGVIAVYAKAGSFDGKQYVKITSGVAANYYYVAGAVAVQTPVTGTTSSTVQSAQTFDAGIAMYVGMSVMAAAGSAVVLKKKH